VKCHWFGFTSQFWPLGIFTGKSGNGGKYPVRTTQGVSGTDIKRFAIECEPQPMHLDEAAAAKTVF
jgi:acyl dehydratase